MDNSHLFKLSLIKARYECITRELNKAIINKDLDKIQELQERLIEVNVIFNKEFERLLANRKND